MCFSLSLIMFSSQVGLQAILINKIIFIFVFDRNAESECMAVSAESRREDVKALQTHIGCQLSGNRRNQAYRTILIALKNLLGKVGGFDQFQIATQPLTGRFIERYSPDGIHKTHRHILPFTEPKKNSRPPTGLAVRVTTNQ